MAGKSTKALALEAWEAGFSIIAHRLNAVLTKVSPNLRIKTKLPPDGSTPAQEARELCFAESELCRLMVLLHGTFRDITPWTYGYVNGKDNKQVHVRLSGPLELHSVVPECLLSRMKEWSVKEWRELIVKPVEQHAAQWRAFLGKRTTRRRTQTTKPRPLTIKQVEAVQTVSECNGNIAEAARKLRLDRKTVEQSYRAGMKKAGMTVPNHKTKHLPSDRRGQANIAEGDDRRQ